MICYRMEFWFVQAWAVGALAAYAMTSQRSGVAVTLLCESGDADLLRDAEMPILSHWFRASTK